MSTPTPTQVVVVTEERKRRKGLVWVAGGAALLLGGSTFALWSQSSGFDGGTITAGDLALTADTDVVTYLDVSGDWADGTAASDVIAGTNGEVTGREIDPASLLMVPGDTVAVGFDAGVTLEGDNLLASLQIDGFDAALEEGAELEVTYALYQGDEAVVAAADKVSELYLAAPEHTAAEGVPGVTVLEDNTADYTVVAFITFPDSVDEVKGANKSVTLSEAALTLVQVRSGAVLTTP